LSHFVLIGLGTGSFFSLAGQDASDKSCLNIATTKMYPYIDKKEQFSLRNNEMLFQMDIP
jgi:hypothetical protein